MIKLKLNKYIINVIILIQMKLNINMFRNKNKQSI